MPTFISFLRYSFVVQRSSWTSEGQHTAQSRDTLKGISWILRFRHIRQKSTYGMLRAISNLQLSEPTVLLHRHPALTRVESGSSARKQGLPTQNRCPEVSSDVS